MYIIFEFIKKTVFLLQCYFSPWILLLLLFCHIHKSTMIIINTFMIKIIYDKLQQSTWINVKNKNILKDFIMYVITIIIIKNYIEKTISNIIRYNCISDCKNKLKQDKTHRIKLFKNYYDVRMVKTDITAIINWY